MNTTMKIFAGIAAAVATTAGAGVALYKKGKSVDFNGKGPFASMNDETDLNNEIGAKKFRDDPLYDTVIVDSEASLKSVTPEFFEEELNKITEWMPITMCGDSIFSFSGYVESLQETGAGISYYYINKSKLDRFTNRITGDGTDEVIISLGSKILSTHDGRYGDIITVSSEHSIGDEYDLHFVNIYGDWKFITYEQLMKDRNAFYGRAGTSSGRRLLRGVQIVALRDDTEEVKSND